MKEPSHVVTIMKYRKVRQTSNGEAHYKVVQDTNHDWSDASVSKQINPATAISGFDIDENFCFIGEEARNYQVPDRAFALKVGVEVMDQTS